MEHLRCVVERITYQNPENGYTVLKCAAKNYHELVTVVGAMPETHVGSVLSLSGSWKMDSKYGRQFAVETFEETLPATVYGIEKYLGSGLIKGVGPKYARRIVQQFGKETLNVIEEEPKRLLEVEGIGKKRTERIIQSWEEQKEIKNIMLFLQGHDISTSHATKIFKVYGSDSIKIVQENPYRLAEDIWGIGFKTADQIAAQMGIEKNRFVRLRSGILYTLNRLAESGHCYANREQLLAAAAKLLEADEATLSMTLDEMLRTKDLIRERIPAAGASCPAEPDLPDGDRPYAADGDSPAAGDISAVKTADGESPAAGDDYAVKIADGENPAAGGFYAGETEEAIFLPPFYFSETGVARRLKQLSDAKRRVHIDPERACRIAAEQAPVPYDPVQRKAIQTALSSKVMILTGGPGTGKTTTTLGILTAYRMSGCSLLLAAPTGRAAKRLSEVTGLEAKTIHRLLEYSPAEGWQRNEDTPLEGDVLLVDECSMIDLLLFYNLLKAVPPHMTLLLVGDADQLPSVGAGNVLKDLIDSGVIPLVRLTRIFRQAQGSRIVLNAHRINRGEAIDMRGGKDSDFFFASCADNEQTVETLLKFCTKNLPAYYHADPVCDIQVLTPMQRGVCGAQNLNRLLQEALNPSGPFLMRSGMCYRLQDKVMQIRNDYDKEVFNGDIGTITDVNTAERELTVDFDGRPVVYDVTELDALTLAYAATIHKAQGSEYPIVVIPFTMSHYVMLQRNLLYTAVTRAKKVLVLIGERRAVSIAIQNEKAAVRNTLLAKRLREELQEHGQDREALFARLQGSQFRARFTLGANDRVYIAQKGMDTIRTHAQDFVAERLAPAQPANDGKQTPMRGHPVFVAQHATATCCRSCLEKWHKIPKGTALTAKQQAYVTDVIMEWIARNTDWPSG